MVICVKKACILLCLVLLFSGCDTASVYTKKDIDKKNEYYSSLSAKKQGWGFRRTENGPEFSKEQIKQMEEYDCIYKESTEEKNIYLTFDEGYENGYTSVILDTLRKKDVKAAFFVTGQYVRENPDLIKRMAKEGHTIGNHTLSHPSLPDMQSTEELKKELFELDRLVYGICGAHTNFLRPPMGEYSEKTLAVSKDEGYTNVFWSQAYVDWKNDTTSENSYKKIISDIHPGCVLLLHAVSKGNADCLEQVIDYARKEGYTFKSLKDYKH